MDDLVQCNITEKNFTEVYFDIRYSGYIDKQQRELDKMKNLEEYSLGLVFDYKEVLSLEKKISELSSSEETSTSSSTEESILKKIRKQ